MSQLNILVYPHTTGVGGSSLNAIELAAAVRDRGHEVAVYAREGLLVDYVRDLGLEYIPAKPARVARETSGRRATTVPATAWDLRRVAMSRGVDVLHGYEWPSIVEAYAAAQASRRTVSVGTVMAMQVAPFIPATIPLIVGTEQLRREVGGTRPGPVHLIEPPVDVSSNHPGVVPIGSSARFAESGTANVVVVSRLANELKLEGVLTAVRAVGLLARSRAVRLVIVGAGEAFDAVAAAAAQANAELGKPAIVLTGEMSDPRPAYEAADVCIGMGGSALRAMAFGKPLIVQGESGFFETLTPGTVDLFLDRGWYGLSDLSPAAATERLVGLLSELLDSSAMRTQLGAFGRRLVLDRFSLDQAAEVQEQIYLEAVGPKPPARRRVLDTAAAVAVMSGYTARRIAKRASARLVARHADAEGS
jgi:glycosyltransferase involved in cell wall biosynthesis